ncbi:MAG: radical SAM protein [Gammaproteobacteria bacterium]|nr:radical SAM protein [Gammaproteobacteria bacterium]
MHKYWLNFKYAVSLGKPLLIWRLVKTYLGIIFYGKRPLRYVDFAIGYSCNLKCDHCFATALEDGTMRRGVPVDKNGDPRKMLPRGGVGRERITPQEYGRIVSEAMALGACNFSFQGGEPTLYPDLLDYIRAAQPSQNVISVTTNGTLLDREKIAALKRAGVDILTISLDSACAEVHDAFRGMSGTFAKSLATIKLAKEMGLHVTVGAVVSHENLYSDDFNQLIKLVTGLDCILFLALASPVGEWANNANIMITPEDREYLDDLCATHPLVRTDFEANWVDHGCGAMKEIIYLTPYGDVLPCPFLHTSQGNVREQSLTAIRANTLTNPYFATYYDRCLAAEDPDYLARYNKGFYKENGQPLTIGEIHESEIHQREKVGDHSC